MIDKVKVLFFIPPAVGGAERITITYAKLLDSNKYNIKFIIVGKDKGDIVNFIPLNYEVGFIHTANIWDFVTLKLFRVLKAECPDVVFCSLIYLNSRIALAVRIAGKIKVILRNNIGLNRVGRLNRFLMKHTYQTVDKIILQTKEMHDEFVSWLGCDKSKCIVIPNPIDKEQIDANIAMSETPYDHNYVNYVFVGRIAYVKGVDVLLKSFAEIVNTIPNARLYIVGKIEEQEYYTDLLQIIRERKLDDSVIFVGFTSNPHRYIKWANCFVLPSRFEGMPNVVLDAIYLRTPIVVCRSVPVIDEMVAPDHGIVVPVDDVEAMSLAMVGVLNIHVGEASACTSGELVKQVFETI